MRWIPPFATPPLGLFCFFVHNHSVVQIQHAVQVWEMFTRDLPSWDRGTSACEMMGISGNVQ